MDARPGAIPGAYVAPLPVLAPPGTAAGAAAIGNPSGSGRVPVGSQLQPYGGAGGQFPMQPHELGADAPYLVDLPPDSLYADRAMRGGVYAFPAFAQFKPMPPNAGGYGLMGYRRPQAPTEAEQMPAQSFVSDASWRDAPPVVDLCRRVPNNPGTGA